MADALTQTAPAGAGFTATEAEDWLTKALDPEVIKRDEDKQSLDRSTGYLDQFLQSVLKPGQVLSKDVEGFIKYQIGEIDKKLSTQLNEVLHHPDFQKLEGTWRGLSYLVHNTETGVDLKIRVLNAKKKELLAEELKKG